MPPRIDLPYRQTMPETGEKKKPRYDYKPFFPPDLDFTPGSELHERIKDAVLERAREAERHMIGQHETWRDMDRTLTSYIDLDTYESALKEDDDRRPVSIVVPETYATLETLLTYSMIAYSRPPTFGYEGVGPEDTYGSILMEAVVDAQIRRGKAMLSLHTWLRDGFTYGFGVMHLKWASRTGMRTQYEDTGYTDPFSAQFVKTGTKRVRRPTVLFEGTEMEPIDPYRYLPDPNVPIAEPQKAEFLGWTATMSYTNLLNMEGEEGSILFNVREMEYRPGHSCIYAGDTSGRNTASGMSDPRNNTDAVLHPIETIWMYWNLIPSDWGLGDNDTPEKWMFGLAGDEVVIAAWPIDLDHGMYPVAVCAPDAGGHEMMPVARLQLMAGLQKVINFYFNSHVLNVRKALNNQFVVDPKRINMRDVLRPGAAKVIRTRRPLWGQGIKDAIEQLQVQDVTQNHMNDLFAARDLSRNYSGAVDSLQGIQRTGGERVTAAEFTETANNAVSRLQKTTMLTSWQGMYDMALMYAYHTQQFMSQESMMRSTGIMGERLKMEMGLFDQSMMVGPADISIAFDVRITDGSSEKLGNPVDWVQWANLLSSFPELQQTMDITRIFLHIARVMGENNAQDFLRAGAPMIPGMQPMVQPQEQIDAGVQQGNLVPFEELAGGRQAV